MESIRDDLYQFSFYNPTIDLTFNQYLLLTDEPVLFHTGDIHQAKELVPRLKELLAGRQLKYIFVSHFEVDECGGLSLMQDNFPEAKVICSGVTDMQLDGFGISAQTIVKKPGDILKTSSYELEFINYPSEMHLWDGLLVFERNRGIFFSSDLMISRGKSIEVVNSNWEDAILSITSMQIPSPEKRVKLQDELRTIKPEFVAVGHGSCQNLS
ncbi:MAG: MBL fold metallo-hydrolase [Tissierellaceae bacterium]|nr:MBL fold metallo-hydrolase [Tissierellaceae bacterium]